MNVKDFTEKTKLQHEESKTRFTIPVVVLTFFLASLASASSPLAAAEMKHLVLSADGNTKTCTLIELGQRDIKKRIHLEGDTYWKGERGCTLAVTPAAFSEIFQFCALSKVRNFDGLPFKCGVSMGGGNFEFTESGGRIAPSCQFTCLTN